MDIPVLKVEQRQEMGKGPARRSRAKGMVPAVCYGQGQNPLKLAVDPIALTTILKSARGLNSLIRLDGAEDRTVFVQEIQRHPVERNLLHIDFLSVDTKKKIERTVPIELVGKAPGVKEGGLLQSARRRLLVEALPADLPEKVEVDVSQMNIGDVIHVNELQMPAGVKAVFERNFTICALVAPTVEEKPAEEELLEGAEAEAGAEGEAAVAGDKTDKKADKKDEGAAKK
jgi:large subunit ribosomal protein L25